VSGDTALVDQIPDEGASFVNCEVLDTSPTTRVLKKPKRRTTKRTARFEFDSPTDATAFECRLDDDSLVDKRERGSSFQNCTSPHVITGLSRGRHSMEIRAIDGDGDPDVSPAVIRWKIVRR